MKHWRKIDKKHNYRPNEGVYSEWKPLLRKESECRCVYCSLHDARFGGERNFHVEHFRPKSNKNFPAFAALKDDYDNLYYACAVCNTFKSNSWFDVEEGDWTKKHFPDPSIFDYCDFFEIDEYFFLVGNHIVARFLVERFHLNRQHLIRERKLESLNKLLLEKITKLDEIFEKIKRLNPASEAFSLLQEFSIKKSEYLKLLQFPLQNSIYTTGELR